MHTSLLSAASQSPVAQASAAYACPPAPPPSNLVATLADGAELHRFDVSSPAFERDVLALRSAVYQRPAAECRDHFDDTALHYVLYDHGTPIYALRSNLASAGPIECEEMYPADFVARFRHCLSSSGRLVRNPGQPSGRRRTAAFLAAAFSDLSTFGARMDIANAIAKLLPYYREQGMMRLRVPTFRHPTWNTVSHILVLLLNPDLPGTINAHLDRVPNPLSPSDLGPICAPIQIQRYA
ncbi:hypothetical protein [Haliangium sp.]|uniref:hypothetical protein n=1 Tax=Haliangium sp. TaxID=2663208 RepID=UPI003D124EB8